MDEAADDVVDQVVDERAELLLERLAHDLDGSGEVVATAGSLADSGRRRGKGPGC